MTGNIINVKGNYYIERGDEVTSTIPFETSVDVVMGYCAIKREELSNPEARKDHPMGKLCLSLIAYIGVDLYGLSTLDVAKYVQVVHGQLVTHKKFLTDIEKERNPLVVYMTQLITNSNKPEPLKKIPGEDDNGYHKCTLTNGISIFLRASDDKLFCNADGYFVQTIFGVTFPYKKEHYKADHIKLILKKQSENKSKIKESTILKEAIRVLELSKNENVKHIINKIKELYLKCQTNEN